MSSYLLPDGYADLTPEDKARICNGCGAGGWKMDIVPDNVLGIDITEPCNIHDYEYYLGIDRVRADCRLLANIMVACETHHPHLAPAVLPIANTYFAAVRLLGGEYFGVAVQ